MPQCSATEATALEDSGPLLLFASQHVKNLDPNLSLAIAEARAAQQANAWTPQISNQFYTAYANLCQAIDPVTMDCLRVAQQTIAKRRWFGFGGTEHVSRAEQSSGRYSTLLVVLLVPLLFLQLYVWTCTNLSKQIDDSFPQYKTQFTQLTDEYTKLDAATSNIQSANWTADEVAGANKISADAAALNADGERIGYAASILGQTFLRQTTSIFSPPSPLTAARQNAQAQWYDDYHSAQVLHDSLLANVPKVEARANLTVGIFASFILPILFGTIGATAYVIRTISDQINKTTFSPTSPIRHVMRVILGALAGVVVGLFNGLTSQFSLPPLAIAFLAGYGVEAVFSMFDNLIQKFR